MLASAGPDLLDLLVPRTYLFNCFGSGAKRSLRIFETRILATYLSDPISFYFSLLFKVVLIINVPGSGYTLL